MIHYCCSDLISKKFPNGSMYQRFPYGSLVVWSLLNFQKIQKVKWAKGHPMVHWGAFQMIRLETTSPGLVWLRGSGIHRKKGIDELASSPTSCFRLHWAIAKMKHDDVDPNGGNNMPWCIGNRDWRTKSRYASRRSLHEWVRGWMNQKRGTGSLPK